MYRYMTLKFCTVFFVYVSADPTPVFLDSSPLLTARRPVEVNLVYTSTVTKLACVGAGLPLLNCHIHPRVIANCSLTIPSQVWRVIPRVCTVSPHQRSGSVRPRKFPDSKNKSGYSILCSTTPHSAPSNINEAFRANHSSNSFDARCLYAFRLPFPLYSTFVLGRNEITQTSCVVSCYRP